MIDPAARVTLGRSSVTVTRLGFGTSGIGGWPEAIPPDRATAAFHAAWDAGIRYFDTAPMYGHGLAERRLGEFGQGRVGEIVISTKVGRLLRPVLISGEHGPSAGRSYFAGEHELNPTFDFSYEGILASLDESRRRTGLDRFDIALLHDPDNHLDEALGAARDALVDARTAGRIRAIGAGMLHVGPLIRLAADGDFDCLLVAGRYTLLEQGALDTLLPLCAQRKISVIAGGVFNSGLLANPHAGAYYEYAPAPRDVLRKAQRIGAICAAFDTPLPAAAIQFPLAHPAVASVVIGMRSAAEVKQNLQHLAHPIPHEMWTALKAKGLLREDAPTPGIETT
jgi:aryl-alcohol dehydrogenase-like predicted oxidoreductase